MKSRLKDILLALKQRMRARDSYERAMRESPARKPFLKTDGGHLSREEEHLRSSQL
jgi:hypothetical protein